MTQDEKTTIAESLFTGGGEMGALMRSFNWSQTSLGSVETWSQSLKTAVRIMLTSRQAMFVWWGDDLINLYNDAYRDILGGKHPQALGQPAAQVWHEIWDQVGPRSESAMLNNEGTYDEALLLIMERNGYPEETYYTFSYSPVPNDQGQTGGIICANTDDTQRIVGERQLTLLRELAARTADARTFDEACTLSANCLETNPYDFPFAMIYLVDSDNQCAVLAGTSGIERGHALAPEIVAVDDDSIWSFATVLDSHQICLMSDLEVHCRDLPRGAWQYTDMDPQRSTPHQAVAVPIAPSGQTGKAGILVAGLNPFRLFDDNYQRFIDLVAAQISASIANAQAYEEERKRAEALAELDRAKTAFFSNVSHEFRTPLTLMLSPLEDLSQTLGDRLLPDEQEQLSMVQRNGLRLQKLVNTLLDFSRIEAGRVQVSYEPTDLATYTAELASVFRSLIERAGMSLVIDCPTLPEEVYVDREMWEKIVLNLLSNAFKFTLVGSITVRLHPVGQVVEFSVIDTGVGIAEAELPRLFERFHRVSGTRARTYEGSGIGLALVQELVKLHGGTIRVMSQLEQGTTFTIALPFGSAHLPSDRIGATRNLTSTATGSMPYLEEALRWLPANKSKVSDLSSELNPDLVTQPSTPNPQPAQTAQILLADDNADMRDYVKRLLSQQYDVYAVTDGAAALAAVRQRLPDLVLTDVMMPEIDGFELLRSLRSDPITQDIPIILLSARAGEESRIEGLAAGADDYLTKPFSSRELLARVEATLKLAQLRREVNIAVQRSEERSRLAIGIAQLGTWHYDPATQMVELDERMREIWGEAENALTLPFLYIMQRIHPDDRARVLNAVEAALAPESSGIYEIDYRIVWDDGTERWISANGQVTFAGEGSSRQIVEFLGTALDISDRKQAEIALRESQALFEAFMRYSPATAFIKDEAGRYLYINPLAERLCKRPLAEWLGKTDFDLFPLAEAQQWRTHDLAAMEAGQAIELTETSVQSDGEHHFISYKFPIPQTSGRQLLGGMSLDVTERYRAETALRNSEEQLRLASEGANLGMWYWDVQTEQLIWTDRAKAMFGLPIDIDMSMQVFLEAVHPDDRPLVQSIITDLQAGQFHTECEYRTRWADGTIRWILARGTHTHNANGTLLATRGVLMDITDRKCIEQALRDSEASFRLIVESAKEYAIFTLDLNGYITRWNSGAQRLLGYTEAEIIGQLGHIIFTPEDCEHGKPEREMQLALMQERAENERWHVRQDGSRFWGSGLMMPLQDETHQTQGFLKILQDKTAERQAAQALREGSDRLKLLYETVSDLLSTEQPMTLMNTLFRKLSTQMDLDCYYHFMLTENQGQPMLHLTHSAGISDAEAEALTWIELGQALCGLVALERRQIALNQAQLLTHPNASGMCSLGATAYAGQPLIAQGRLLGTLSFLSRTRTQFTPEEVSLLQAISDQVAVALDRTALVESLQQQREQLIRANRIKDEFLAVVSHELRSPLNPILGWSALLQTQKLDPAKTAQALSIIERNAKLQAELINDLLDVSRILQGKLSLNVAPVDLISIIQAAMETVRLAAEAKSIYLHTQFEANVGFVAGDASRLQQVVWNLLSNAVKFTPEGGQVDVHLKRVESKNQGVGTRENPLLPSPPSLCPTYAQITVTDTGKGIPSDFLPHVFEYFRQADATTTRKFGGLGLGLAIVRYLVELHGGTVQADSLGEDQGATFTVRLPLMPPQPAPKLDASSFDHPLDLHGIQILVVDDDDSSREFTTFLLELRGARVTAAASAREALRILSQSRPDILLSDIGMPDMDGYMLIQQVRTLAIEQGGQIPAIALTAYAGEIDYQHVMAAGFQKHVPKPVDPDTLVSVIVSLIQHFSS